MYEKMKISDRVHSHHKMVKAPTDREAWGGSLLFLMISQRGLPGDLSGAAVLRAHINHDAAIKR